MVRVPKFLFGGDHRTLRKLLVISLRASWTVNAVPHWRTSSWKIGFLFLLDWILLSILKLHLRNLTSRNMMVGRRSLFPFERPLRSEKSSTSGGGGVSSNTLNLFLGNLAFTTKLQEAKARGSHVLVGVHSDHTLQLGRMSSLEVGRFCFFSSRYLMVFYGILCRFFGEMIHFDKHFWNGWFNLQLVVFGFYSFWLARTLFFSKNPLPNTICAGCRILIQRFFLTRDFRHVFLN